MERIEQKENEHQEVSSHQGKKMGFTQSLIKNHQVYTLLVTALVFFAAGFFVHDFFFPANKASVVPKTSNNSNNLQPSETKPGRIAVSVDGDPFLGREDAPLTIIEFSDYQCPFCRTFWSDTLDQLKADFVDTGTIKFVYRDFPLSSIHPGAQKAAEAAECAQAQGKYWQMHDKIYDEQSKRGQGTVQFEIDDLKDWAAAIGLNMNQFNGCLDSGRYQEEVQKDLLDGKKAGVEGTPTFFIGNQKIGYVKLVGAQPYSVFRRVILQELELTTGKES